MIFHFVGAGFSLANRASGQGKDTGPASTGNLLVSASDQWLLSGE